MTRKNNNSTRSEKRNQLRIKIQEKKLNNRINLLVEKKEVPCDILKKRYAISKKSSTTFAIV